MIPQGSTLINIDHFANMTAAVNACESCEQLQGIAGDAFASLDAVKAGIQSELAALAPILALLSPPSASPAAIVTWLTSFITTTLTPMVKPTITYAAQLAAMLDQIATLTAAIGTASAKFPSCSVEIPAP